MDTKQSARLKSVAVNDNRQRRENNKDFLLRLSGASWKPIPGAGSDRQYSRLEIPDKEFGDVVRVVSEDTKENKTFIDLADSFRDSGISVPEVYAVNNSGTTYYQQDLGTVDLFSLLREPQFEDLAAEALRMLARLQSLPPEKWERFVQHPPFSERQVMYDLNYFKYCFLKPTGIVFDEDRLQDDLDKFAQSLSDTSSEEIGFMYRDFQSRNIMISDGKPYFIDFQGGRLGPVLYDAVSFIWQAKADLPEDMKKRLLKVYLEEYEKVTGVSKNSLQVNLDKFRLFRTLQVLGAYGMRGLTQRRAHFLRSIPLGLKNLRELLDSHFDAVNYPELYRVCKELCEQTRFKVERENDGKLKVTVSSFSYMRGYPEDLSGNGGGFIFDCRGLHNPGRYMEYKTLTGRDEPVIKFLEERGEVSHFLESAYDLADMTIARYRERGFTSLQIGFGCTGGQHRSVYCAEHMARHLKECFPDVMVRLIHREQKIEEIL